MHQHLDGLRGRERDGLERFRRHAHVVVPVGLAEGEVLTQVADRGRAAGERRRRVLEGGRAADHEIAEMGGDGCRRRHRHQLIDVLEDEAGALGHVGAAGRGVAHAPVEADAVAVHPVARLVDGLVDLGIGAPALVRVAEADLGVQHDVPTGHAPALVLGLGFDAVMLVEGRAPDGVGARRLAPLGDQLGRARQLGLGQDRGAVEGGAHVAIDAPEPRRMYSSMAAVRYPSRLHRMGKWASSIAVSPKRL